jgi:hypothetical protein
VAAGFDRRGDAGRVVIVVTNAPPFDASGIRTGTPKRKARRRLRGERTIARRVLAVRRRHDVLVAGLSKGRVSYLASASRRLSARRTVRFLAKLPR